VAGYFFDSSALVKPYHPEPGTPEVLKIFGERGRRILVSRLTPVEIQSAVAVKVRTGAIGKETAEALRRRVVGHAASGELAVFTLTDAHYAAAERLIAHHAFDHRLRSLDALHLAVAGDLREQGLVDCLVASDRAICEVAPIERFSVVNPEAP
jgi:predicted nucleic acid-binding protein